MADYSREGNLRQIAALSPSEEAASLAHETSQRVRLDLEQAIAAERDPAKKAVLLGLHARDFGGAAPEAAPSRLGAFLSAKGATEQPGGSRASLSDFLDNLQPAAIAPAPKSAGLLRTAGDIALKGAQGVVGLGESVVGLADLATGGYAGRGMAAIGYDPKATKQFIGEGLSDAQKQADQRVADADGIVDTVSTALQNPRAIMGSVAESVPGVLGIGGVSSMVARRIFARAAAAAGGIGTAAGQAAGQAAVEAAAGRLMWAGAGAEGAQTAGSIAEQARQADPSDPSKMYYGVPAGIATALIGRGAGKLLGDAETAIFTGAKSAGLKGGLPARIGKGMLSEGALEEMPQSAQEQVFTNMATGRPAGEGVGNAAGMGLVTGAAMGGGMAMMQGRTPGDAVREANLLPESGPLTRSLNAGTEAVAQGLDAAAPIVTPAAAPLTRRQEAAPMAAALAQLTPDARQEALQMLAVADNMQIAGSVRRRAQNRLDVLLGGVVPQTDEPVAVDPATGEIAPELAPVSPAGQPPSYPTSYPPIQAADAYAQREADRPPEPTGEVLPGDILNPLGQPFKSMRGAMNAKRDNPGHEIVRVADGLVVRRTTENTDGQPDVAEPAGLSVGPTDGSGADVGASAAPAGSGGPAVAVGAESQPDAALSDDIPTLKKQWAEAVRANDNALASRINDRIVELKSAPTSEPNNPPRVGPSNGPEAGIADKPGSAQPEAAQNIDAAANQAATSPANDLPQPTEAQKKAGNYAKGHAAINGLDLSIENPAGSTRSGTDRDGKAWTNTLQHHYGYIKGTVGNDKDHIDVFVKPGTPQDHAGPVFVADQIHPDTGKFDEHKALIGFSDEVEARAAYAANYAPGWKGLQSITAMPFDGFKAWVMDGAKRKPVATLKDRVDAKRQQAEPAAPSVDALREELRKVEDAILRAAPAKFAAGGGDIDAAMKRREVPTALKDRRKALRDQIRAASQDAAAPAEKAAATAAVPEAAASADPMKDRVDAMRAKDSAAPTTMGQTEDQRRAKIDAEVMESRTDAPQVAQPTAGKSVKVFARTLNGIKEVRAKLYELPGYTGPQLALAEYKSPRGQGYRVYLPKSGSMLQDSNGVSTLEDTLKLAVQRVKNARDAITKRNPDAAAPADQTAPAQARVPEAAAPEAPAQQNLQQRLDDARRIGREAAQRGDPRDPPAAFTSTEKQVWRAGWDQGKSTGKPTPQVPPLQAPEVSKQTPEIDTSAERVEAPKVAGDKLTELKAERARIEQVVAEAYAKTAAGKPAAVPDGALSFEGYAEAINASPREYAVGLRGDAVPVSFTQRQMAQARLDDAPAELARKYQIVGVGKGANRRYWVTPTYDEYLRKAQSAEPEAATHKDPGEPAEAATPAVVAESIKTAAARVDRKPSEMRAELLAKIDAAMETANDDPDKVRLPKIAGLTPTTEATGEEAAATREAPQEAAGEDMRGYAWALVKDGKVVRSGSLPSPQFAPASDHAKLSYYKAMADKAGADLYIGGYPGASAWAPQEGLIFGMTWAELSARQQKGGRGSMPEGKMPKDAVLAYSPAAPQEPAAAEDEAPKLTEAQARKQFEWRDMGQSGGTKTHRLFFYFKPEDKGTGAAMGRGYVELYEGSSGWRVDGEGESFKALADAKKAAVEAAIPVLREQGWIEPAAPAVEQGGEPSSLNKRHGISKSQVLTPAGSIKAAATDSKAPSSLWYYQGDMGMLQFQASVTVEGHPDQRAGSAKALLAQIKAAQDAGWRRSNYRAGSLGTVWVFEREGEFLTRAGMENTGAAEFQRPELSENKPGFLSMATQQFELAKAFNDWLQTLPPEQQQNRGVVVRKMGETPVGEWARVEDDPNGNVTLAYYDKGATQFRIRVSAKSWPEMVKYVAGLAERFEKSKTADEHTIGVLQREAEADAPATEDEQKPKTLRERVDAKKAAPAEDKGEQDGKTAMFSIAEESGAVTATDLRASLVGEFGADAIKALEEAGLLTITDRPPANLPAATAGSATGNRISLYTTPGASAAVAYHEALHATLRKTIGDAAYDALMSSLPQRGTGNRRFFAEAERRIPPDTPASVRAEELAAYAVEAYQKNREAMPAGVRKWVQDFLAALKAGLAKALQAAGVGMKLRVALLRDAGVLHKLAGDGLRAMAREQIKSAIGNNGNFDPASSDIRLSISDTLQDHVKAIRGIDQQKVRNAFADMVGNAGAKVSWWDKHLGTQHAKAEKFPAYKRVFERVQSYIEDVSTLANEAADQAPAILPKLETWKDLKKSFQQFGLKKADAEAVAAPIFQGTLTDQKVYSDEELRQQFGLNPEQINAYRQFRNAVDTSLDQVVAADVLRLLGDKNPLRDLALADRDSMRTGIDAYLDQQIAASDGKAKAEFQALQKDIREKYERVDKLKDEGYAPLMRFGQYKVYVSDPDSGESLFFGLYESKAEANKMARDLAEDPQFNGKTIEQGVLSQEQYKLFNSVPVESLEMFADAIGAEKSEVFQAYLRLAKNNRSALKRLIHRKGTAGFSEDVPRVLASFITSNSRMASGAMNLTAAKNAIEDIRDGDVKDEAIQLVESVQNPKETASAARSLMFMNFIGGSIASAAVNLTQPLTMTLPYLSQFGGLSKATARLMAAGKMVATGRVSDPELRAALKKAELDSTVAPQEIHHLTAQAMGTWGKSALSKRLAFVWGAPFSLAEQFNRRISFCAAFQTAQAEGIDDPFAFAKRAVVETQGLYNKGNMPNLSRSAIGATAMQFKQYGIHYLEWMQRMYRSGPEGKKAVLIALAMLMAAAGTDGLPFADDIGDLIDTIGQALGLDVNTRRAKRNFIANTLGLGDMAADVVARGLSAMPGVPMDVSLRMGMGNLLPGTGAFLRSNTDRSADLLEFAGPAGGMAKQYMGAIDKGLDGDVAGMVKGAMPMAVQNAIKAVDMWQTGEARDTMGRKVMEADAVDGFMRFLGFNPAPIARESEKMGMIRRSEQLAKNVEGEIAGKWARAAADGDREAVQAAIAERDEWNSSNPDLRIEITQTQIRQRVRKLKQSRAERFITSISPERRAAATQ